MKKIKLLILLLAILTISIPTVVNAKTTEDSSENTLIGWQTIDNNIYFYENNKYYTGLHTIDTKNYYFNKKGQLQIRWFKHNNKWMYSNEKGIIQYSKWIQDNNNWYYLDKNGYMVTGWQEIKNKWYYFSKNGSMKIGWVKDNNSWYYMNPSTGIMSTGWLYWNNKYYYLNTSGKMITGWIYWRSNYYYANSSGELLINQLFKVGNKSYISNLSGKLYRNKLIKLNNIYYYLLDDYSVRFLNDQKAAEIAYSLNGDLKKAMEYACSITYWGRNEFDASWGSTKLAEYGITNKKGNCFVKAATFRDIAYAMGYDVHQIDGHVKVKSGLALHSWVEVEMNNKLYICDPSYARVTSVDFCYLFEYGKKGTYQYVDYKRMN